MFGKIVRMKRPALAALVLGLGLGLAAGEAYGDTVSYQGFLQDDNGSPLSGPVDLTFRIYAASSGGSSLWTESFNDVALENGVFSIVLGQTSPLTETLFNGNARWLETSVDGTALTPRRPFTSVPYAMYSNVAEIALNGAPDDDWVIDGDNIYRIDGNVGVGTPDPWTKLHLQTARLGITSQDIAPNGIAIVEAEDAGVHLFSDATGPIGSEVGLLEVNSSGDVYDKWTMGRLTSSDGSKLRMRWTRGAANASVMTLLPSNRVGIGTESPTNELSVAGDVDAQTYQATSALNEFTAPLPGGVYRDNVVYAWAYVRGDGVILESFGVDRVQRTGVGAYSVYYETPLNNATCPIVTAQTSNDPVLATIGNLGPTGCAVRVKYDQGTSWAFIDNAFFIQVVGRP